MILENKPTRYEINRMLYINYGFTQEMKFKQVRAELKEKQKLNQTYKY